MLKQARQNVLNFVEVSGLLVKRAMDEIGHHRNLSKQAAAVAKPTLQAMADNKLVTSGNLKQAETLLGTHKGTIELLQSCIEKIAQQAQQLATLQATGVGAGVTKQASVVPGDIGSPYCGAKTPHMKQSDRDYLAVLRKTN